LDHNTISNAKDLEIVKIIKNSKYRLVK